MMMKPEPIRSRSQPAAHLTPRLLGTIMGSSLGLIEQQKQQQRINKKKKKVENQKDASQIIFETSLKMEGIRTNKINDVWTGVSGARWRGLCHWIHTNLHHSFSSSSSPENSSMNELGLSIVTKFLWDISKNKKCLLDYIMAMEFHRDFILHHQSTAEEEEEEKEGSKGILGDSSLCQALKHNLIGARDEWSQQCFAPDDISSFTSDHGDKGMEDMLRRLMSSTTSSSSSWNEDLEKCCSVIGSLNLMSGGAKPPVPRGRFGYDDGPAKPDCVEMMVRELFDLLLWDERNGRFDLNRLSSLNHDDDDHDDSKMMCLKRLYGENDNNSENEEKFYGVGQRWFSALSDQEGCSYISTSPSGKRYELVPTLSNVAEASRVLLLQDDKTDYQKPWTTLDDVANYWNSSIVDTNNNINKSRRTTRPKLIVTQRVSSHRPSLISDEIKHEEIATAYMEDSNFGIEMKLCKSRALATVTHIRRRRQRRRLRKEIIEHQDDIDDEGLDVLVQEFFHQFVTNTHLHDSTASSSPLRVLAPAVLGLASDDVASDGEDLLLHHHHQNSTFVLPASSSSMNNKINNYMWSLLTTRIGIANRRHISLLSMISTTDTDRILQTKKEVTSRNKDIHLAALDVATKLFFRFESENPRHQKDDEVESFVSCAILRWIIDHAVIPSTPTGNDDNDDDEEEEIEKSLVSPIELIHTFQKHIIKKDSNNCLPSSLRRTLEQNTKSGRVTLIIMDVKSGRLNYWDGLKKMYSDLGHRHLLLDRLFWKQLFWMLRDAPLLK